MSQKLGLQKTLAMDPEDADAERAKAGIPRPGAKGSASPGTSSAPVADEELSTAATLDGSDRSPAYDPPVSSSPELGSSSNPGTQSSGVSGAFGATTAPNLTAPPLGSLSTLTSSATSRAITLEQIDDQTSFDEIRLPPADPLIGVVVAERYRIVEQIGRGGMGIVYRVEHARIGKLLAMKLLTGELSRNPEVVRRFKHEALTASKLSSPNTVQVFDFGVSDGLTYLVMELVTGEDLGRVLKHAGPLPSLRLIRIIIQVCSSLAEAHGKGIVHRDVKPENIMLVKARDGTDIAKVLDFGLAKLREGSELNDVTSQGAIVGTPYFMSPEQVRGDPVDPRSDVYSVGAVMYKVATGHYPFNGPTPMAVFTKHLTEDPPPPVERTEGRVGVGLSRIIMRSLAKEPADRYQRIEELQAALVEEMSTLSDSGVGNLLDSNAVRKLADVASRPPPAAVAGQPPAVATRNELEAYERKLRRKRWGLMLFLCAIPASGGYFAYEHLQSQPERFGGTEIEPNNAATEATDVPFGTRVEGHLGQRLDRERGDRDFYRVEIPELGDAAVALQVTSLPNFPMCTFLYREDQTQHFAQYCVGRAALDLQIRALQLAPGTYYVAVMQDRDSYGRYDPFVHENVSDPYEVLVEKAQRDSGYEVEPNDQEPSATRIGLGEDASGALGWVRDEDVFCAAPDIDEPVVFTITDSDREAGTALEVVPIFEGREGVGVRVHELETGEVTSTDVVSPWNAPAMEPDDKPRCVRLRAVPDPWTSAEALLVPRGSQRPYSVRLERP